MNLKKKHSMITGVVLVLIMISAELFMGCTTNKQNSNGNQNVPVSYPVFSAVDSDILNTAYEDYDVLRNNMNASDARVQLLDTLNNEIVGVKEADLGLDGSTIFVTFSDGDFAMVDTFELDEIPTQGTGFSYPMNGEVQSDDYLARNTLYFDTVPPETSGYTSGNFPGKINYDLIVVGAKNKTTCTSKKVLVLAPCYWEFDEQPTDACISLFKANGWTDEDITLKLVKKNPEDANFDCNLLTPEDYFNLGKYGIILFTGHGAIKAHKTFEEDNLYLQFCYADNASFLNNPQLQQWKDEKTLVIAHEYRAGRGNSSRYIYDTYIRADFLRQKIGTLPSSYLNFATCFGRFFNEMYLEKGAKIFLGWDNSVKASHADGNMLAMVQNMLEHDVRVYDAYVNHSVIKSYDIRDPDNPERGLILNHTSSETASFLKVNFDIYPDPSSDDISFSYYFPAWFDKITVTGIPDEADSVSVTLISSAGISLASKSYSVSSSTLIIEDLDDVVFPASGTPTIQVKALDGNGKELVTGQAYCVVSAGANSKQINLTGYEDKTHAEYTYGSSYSYNITIDLTVSSNEWETGKEITATAICTLDPIGDGPNVGVPGFQITFLGANGEVVAYDPPIVGGENFGQSYNGRDPGVGWGAPPVEGWWGSPATFTATFRLESKGNNHPCILAKCMWSSWGETDWAKIYIR